MELKDGRAHNEPVGINTRVLDVVLRGGLKGFVYGIFYGQVVRKIEHNSAKMGLRETGSINPTNEDRLYAAAGIMDSEKT